MRKIIEIRAAEGGEDSKLFVSDLAGAYQRLGNKLGWTTRLIDVRPGECSIEIEGDDLSGLQTSPVVIEYNGCRPQNAKVAFIPVL